MPIHTTFIRAENKRKYSKKVLTWLEIDFIKQGKPKEHFWHNEKIIAQAFDELEAMVVLDDSDQIVGYMIWTMREANATIEIIEVVPEYRQQGIFKKMLTDFSIRFSDICVLSATVLPQAETVFSHSGWEKISINDHNRLTTRYFRIIKPTLPKLDILPNGCVIAVFSQADVADSHTLIDYYKIKVAPNNYQMKYFQVDLDEHGKLSTPLVTTFHNEGYIGIYLDRKLIIEGKAKHIFKPETFSTIDNLLILNKIAPHELDLFIQKGFFTKLQITSQSHAKSIVFEKERKIAFLCGLHPRLGSKSPIRLY
jgi:hypothetical protein